MKTVLPSARNDGDEDCLSESQVLALLGGALSGEEADRAHLHIDSCSLCQDLVATLAQNEDAPSQRVSSPTTTASSNELRQGSLVDGRYSVEELIGRGAMAAVYRVHDERLGVHVALKVLYQHPNRVTAQELKVARRVTHRNVCRVYDAGSIEGCDYLTMELIDGLTLDELLAKGRLSLQRGLDVLEQVAAGLAAAHAQGIVHCDLKPANVLVDATSDRVVLTDFGLAHDIQVKRSRARLVGTPQYWAPEQARGEEPTPASDVYSLGVMAYRIFSGAELRLSNPNAIKLVPRPLRSLVERALEGRPSDRYANAGVFADALRSCAQRARLIEKLHRSPFVIGANVLVFVLFVIIGVVAGIVGISIRANPNTQSTTRAAPSETPPRSTATTSSRLVESATTSASSTESSVPLTGSEVSVPTGAPQRAPTHAATATISATSVRSASPATIRPTSTSSSESDLLYRH